MLAIKTAVTKIIALLLCALEIMPASQNLSAIKSSLSRVSLITNEEISTALLNAEFVDEEDSLFYLHSEGENVSSSSEYEDDVQMPLTDSASNRNLLTESGNDIPGVPMVYYTQLWLNQTYGHISDFDQVPENGRTGWPTIRRKNK